MYVQGRCHSGGPILWLRMIIYLYRDTRHCKDLETPFYGPPPTKDDLRKTNSTLPNIQIPTVDINRRITRVALEAKYLRARSSMRNGGSTPSQDRTSSLGTPNMGWHVEHFPTVNVQFMYATTSRRAVSGCPCLSNFICFSPEGRGTCLHNAICPWLVFYDLKAYKWIPFRRKVGWHFSQ